MGLDNRNKQNNETHDAGGCAKWLCGCADDINAESQVSYNRAFFLALRSKAISATLCAFDITCTCGYILLLADTMISTKESSFTFGGI
jgi:hypothetical protein